MSCLCQQVTTKSIKEYLHNNQIFSLALSKSLILRELRNALNFQKKNGNFFISLGKIAQMNDLSVSSLLNKQW